MMRDALDHAAAPASDLLLTLDDDAPPDFPSLFGRYERVIEVLGDLQQMNIARVALMVKPLLSLVMKSVALVPVSSKSTNPSVPAPGWTVSTMNAGLSVGLTLGFSFRTENTLPTKPEK